MTIRQNIQNVIDTIQQERNAGGGRSQTGDDVQAEAQAAILAGQGQPPGTITAAWERYMRRFAGNPVNVQQLARLLPTDGTHTNANMEKERAYLVSNGMCGANTTDDLTNGTVTDFLDT